MSGKRAPGGGRNSDFSSGRGTVMTAITLSASAGTGPAGPRRSFADLSVNVKVIAAVGTAAVVALAVGLLGLSSLSDASTSAQLIYRSNVASIKAVGQLQAVILQARVDAANQALSVDAAATKKFTDSFTTDMQNFTTAMAAYRASQPASDTAQIDQLQTNWDAYTDIT